MQGVDGVSERFGVEAESTGAAIQRVTEVASRDFGSAATGGGDLQSADVAGPDVGAVIDQTGIEQLTNDLAHRRFADADGPSKITTGHAGMLSGDHQGDVPVVAQVVLPQQSVGLSVEGAHQIVQLESEVHEN